MHFGLSRVQRFSLSKVANQIRCDVERAKVFHSCTNAIGWKIFGKCANTNAYALLFRFLSTCLTRDFIAEWVCVCVCEQKHGKRKQFDKFKVRMGQIWWGRDS